MAITTRLLTPFAVIGLVAACAQQEAPGPQPIQPQPIYNKMGDVVGCEGGATYNPNRESFENPCEPRECEEQTASTANYLCRPPGQEDGGGRDNNGEQTGAIG